MSPMRTVRIVHNLFMVVLVECRSIEHLRHCRLVSLFQFSILATIAVNDTLLMRIWVSQTILV